MRNERTREPKIENSKNKACEMMKERFTKLLLGDDMSGSGNGVSTALAISNAITNLCATIFGHVWRLEPLSADKKSKWLREMEWFLSVSDHILELVPCWQTFPDGSRQEVMKSRPRSDLYINLPALRKLDNMLLGILDSFESPEFWYVDKGIINPEYEQGKWWLPVPRVPPGGLTEDTRKILQHRRDCTNQILKAATAINGSVLAEMEIPDSYLEALPTPKNVKTILGDLIHRYITSDQFTPECLLDSLDLASDHHALEISDRVEAAMHAWRRKTNSNTSYSWENFKDFVSDADRKREQLSDRAGSVLLCLKRRFPGMPQTTLTVDKIKHNKDVGKSILESYSRVLRSLAFNIVMRIEDLVYVDNLPCNKSVNRMSGMNMMTISRKSNGSLPCSPYRSAAFSSPSYSPNLVLFSPAKGSRSPLMLKRASLDCNGKGNGLRRNLFSPSPESSCGSKKAISRLKVNE